MNKVEKSFLLHREKKRRIINSTLTTNCQNFLFNFISQNYCHIGKGLKIFSISKSDKFNSLANFVSLIEKRSCLQRREAL